MRIASRILTAVLCVSLALSVSGCGLAERWGKPAQSTSEPTLKKDPSVSGPLTVYTSAPRSETDAYLASFRTLYPNVQLTVVSDTPTATVDKVIKEASAPVADVIWHVPLSYVMSAIEATAVAPYSFSQGELDPIAADFTDSNLQSSNYVGLDARLVGFAVNTAVAGDAVPAAFADLLDPKLKGKIVAPSVRTEAGYTMVSNLLANMDEQTGWTYLDNLNKNIAYYTDDEGAPVVAASSGQAAVGIGWDDAIVAAQAADKTVKAVFPGDPELSPWTMDVVALVKKPQISTAAKKFMVWAISTPAMKAYAKDTPVVAAMGNMKLPAGYFDDESNQTMNPNDFSFSADNRARIIAEWMKRYGGKIKK